jgi:NodT family efflux transporter outer membrane factor (OMF) lipoprotein
MHLPTFPSGPAPRLGAALILLSAGGCSFAPEPEVPQTVQRVPEAYEESTPPRDSAWSSVHWWRAYDDPTLDRLVDTVLAANLDLVEAVGRVEESRALAGVALADLLPSLSGSADANYSSTPANAGFGQIIGGGEEGDSTASFRPDRFETTDYSAALTLSYELDLWGRARNDRGAALAEALASESDAQAVQLGVLAEAITAYFEVAELRRRIALTDEAVGVLQERADLTQVRYDRGLVTSFELYQIREQLRNAQAGLPQLRALLTEAETRLAVVSGRYPGELAALLQEPALPEGDLPPVPGSLPADLLWQRPDVRAAGRRLEAARLRVGARRAELLPGLSLTGTLGLQAADPENLLDLSQWFTNLTAGLTAPLFQGGRLRANVRAQEARYVQQTAAYGRTVLTAVAEVESALARHRQEAERFAFLRDQLQEAQASVDLQASRYEAGVTGYADYLDALRNRLVVEGTLAQAARDYALSRLGLHRALGGTWVPDPVPEETRGAPEDAS